MNKKTIILTILLTLFFTTIMSLVIKKLYTKDNNISAQQYEALADSWKM